MINGYKIDLEMAITDGKYNHININFLQKFIITLIREIRKIEDITEVENLFLAVGSTNYTICIGKYSVNPIIYEFY